ncbi:MAG: hypothetical protein CVV13_11785 [Gammaproteobacteria bacterium HGW-Gammaproteobacteria-3]|nr:MAG: hypothetical protein CVV13_11785 [Gammaproteobacteria bacterium HGW-Gammaproteobacteria-3]
MNFKKWWPFKRKRSKAKKDEDGHLALQSVYTSTNDIAIGMYVAELDRPWLETDFKFQGFEIKTAADIQKIKETCDYVYIDYTKNKKRLKQIPNTKPELTTSYDFPPPPPKLSVFEKEIGNAQKIYHDTGLLVADFMERIGRGEGVDTKSAKQAVAECVNSIS